MMVLSKPLWKPEYRREKMTDIKNDIKEMDYETAMSALQIVISNLESQQLTLDKSLDLFEEGQLLINRCNELLEKAELRIQTLQDLD